MTVIRPNSISGVSSITTNGGDLSLFRSDGTTSDIIINNVTSGIITATSFVGSGTALTGIDAATLKFGSDTKAQAVAGGVNITGNLGVSGVLTYEDVTNIDSVGVITARDGLRVTGISTFAGNLLPSANNTHDLGATGTRWANAYVNDMHFSNKGSSNSVDGTWGDWTLQEGENKIYMINNRTGKKYSLKMEEV
jgi:hypothetical protein